jgi:hypothetical protein
VSEWRSLAQLLPIRVQTIMRGASVREDNCPRKFISKHIMIGIVGIVFKKSIYYSVRLGFLLKKQGFRY